MKNSWKLKRKFAYENVKLFEWWFSENNQIIIYDFFFFSFIPDRVGLILIIADILIFTFYLNSPSLWLLITHLSLFWIQSISLQNVGWWLSITNTHTQRESLIFDLWSGECEFLRKFQNQFMILQWMICFLNILILMMIALICKRWCYVHDLLMNWWIHWLIDWRMQAYSRWWRWR